MYKDWLKKKNRGRIASRKTLKEVNEAFKKDSERFESLINGTFWNLFKPDFEKLSDEEIGKKSKEILKLLEPFHQPNLRKPFKEEIFLINITKELKHNLSTNDDEYIIEPESWGNDRRNFIIDCNSNNIWCKTKYERSQANVEEAKNKGFYQDVEPSLSNYRTEAYTSLRELYEEKIESGLSTKDLREYVNSNDLLKHLFFLYVVKRAQHRDEEAVKLLIKMYEHAAVNKANQWIKRIELAYGVKFKLYGELGSESIKRIAKIFLRLLITGDDPEAILDYIKKIDSDRNIEIFFTRKLAKKLKDLVSLSKEYLEAKINEYKELISLDSNFDVALDSELGVFPADDINHFNKKLKEAQIIARKPWQMDRTTYREFMRYEQQNSRIKELLNIYYELEDNCIKLNDNYFPSLCDKKFDNFSTNEIKTFERLKANANLKVSALGNNSWFGYRDFLDEEDLTDKVKEIYEIYKKYENFYHVEYRMKLEVLRVEILTAANPYCWLNRGNLFNDKLFDAARNSNFTNWLFWGTSKKPSALESLLFQWFRSKEFISGGKVKAEHIELGALPKETKKSMNSIENENDTDFEEALDNRCHNTEHSLKDNPRVKESDPFIITRIINEFLALKKSSEGRKDRNRCLLKEWINRKGNNERVYYEELGKNFGLKRRQTINLCKDFEEFARKRLKR